MRRMMMVGRLGLGGLLVDVRRQDVGEAERGADADRDPAAGLRQLLAARPDPVRAGDPDRHDRRPGAQGERRDPVAALLERAVAAARALREHEQDVALVEDALGQPERLDVGAAAVDRVHAAVRGRSSPTTGQSKSSFLPSHWNRRPIFGMSHEPEHDRVEVRGVVGGDDDRALARDLVERALDADARHAAPEQPPAEASARRSAA